MILGQSGSPVLIYAECEQVGLIDHVHPEFMSLELLFGFLYFLESVHLNLVKIKNVMGFTVQLLAFPCVNLNLSLFSSSDGSAQPLRTL